MQKLSYVLFALMISATACQRSPATAKAPCIDPAKIRKDAICTMEYDPVCGCDGKTYSNPCVATNAGVTSFTKGACGGTNSQ